MADTRLKTMEEYREKAIKILEQRKLTEVDVLAQTLLEKDKQLIESERKKKEKDALKKKQNECAHENIFRANHGHIELCSDCGKDMY